MAGILNPFAVGDEVAKQTPNYIEMAFRNATAQLESQTARAEEASEATKAGVLSNFDVQALLKDAETATNPNQLQQILVGVGEGMMQSAYAGNRVMGAAIAKSAGYNEAQIAKQLSLKGQVINMARSVVDLRHAEVTTKLAEKYGEKETETKIAAQEAQTKYVGALTTAAEVNTEESRVKLDMLREDALHYAETSKTQRDIQSATLTGMQKANEFRAFEFDQKKKIAPYEEEIAKSQAAIATNNATPEMLDIMKKHGLLSNQLLEAQALRMTMEAGLFKQRADQQAEFYKRTGWGPSQFGMAVQLFNTYQNTAVNFAGKYKILSEKQMLLADEVNSLNQQKIKQVNDILKAHPGWGWEQGYQYWRGQDKSRTEAFDRAYWQLTQNSRAMKDAWERCQDAGRRADQLQNTLNEVDQLFSGTTEYGYSVGGGSTTRTGTPAPTMSPDELVNPTAGK